MKNPEKVPVLRVLEDMYSDTAIAPLARSYYYVEYATEKERKKMDREDKIKKIYVFAFYAGVIGLALGSLVASAIS